ncbi:MAG: GtrA family protein [Clostridia bacterium]|nr:GtrA family protein [Clostridia bacterium]
MEEKIETKKQNKLIKLYIDFNEKHKKLCEILRFIVVGGIATVIDYIVMGIVLYLFDPGLYPHFYNVWIGGGEPSTIATVVGTGMGFCVSLVANYLLSVLFVYEEKGSSKTVKGAIMFAVFSAIGLLLNMAGMWLGYDICGINEWVTKILMTFIVLVYNYLTRKLFIFNDSNNKNEKIVTEELTSENSQNIDNQDEDNKVVEDNTNN